jgi:hypothetical protein
MKCISVLGIVLIGLITPSRVQSEIRYGQVHKYYVGDVPYIVDVAEHNGDYEKRPLHFGDFNNDDIVDLFVINDKESSKVTILHGAGTGTFDYDSTLNFNQKAYDYLILDLDRNGFDDVLLAINDFVYFAFLNDGSGDWTGTGGISDPYLKYLNGVCDCNDDGFDDFIGHSEYDDVAMGTHFIIGINDSLYFWPIKYLFHENPGVITKHYPVGDFNGDRRIDFLASGGWEYQWLAVYTDSDSCNFEVGQAGYFGLGINPKLIVGNFNGDQCDDIALFNYFTEMNNCVYITYGSPDGLLFSERKCYHWLIEYEDCMCSWNSIASTDLNGDGYDDIGVVERDFDEVNDLLPVYFHYSDGDSFSLICDTLIVPSERYAHLWSADFNDDGADDLCYFSSIDTLAVYLSEAQTATLLRSFHARFEQNRGVVIDWEVTGTEDCERFVISCSMDDEPFSVLVEVPAVTGKLAYSYTDGQVQSALARKIRYRLDVYEKDGSTRLLALEEVVVPDAVFRLYQNYPNPFNPGTKIIFELPARMKVWLEIYDVTGRLVRRLVSGRELGPGRAEEFWDGRNEQGLRVSSGVYHCTLRAGKETISRKLVILR